MFNLDIILQLILAQQTSISALSLSLSLSLS